MSSSVICLAILFPKAWQHQPIFHYRAHFAFLVLTSTTVYSFYLDRKSKTKPDAYGIISSAAFATMSLCMSKSIDCGFMDLMFFFCGVLITQLMEIKPLLGLVGMGVSYFLINFRSYLDDPAESLGSPDNYYATIDIDSPQSISNRASSLDVRPLPPESSIQNFDANFTALEITQLERPPSLEQLRRLRRVLRLLGLAELRPVAMPRQLPRPRLRLKCLEWLPWLAPPLPQLPPRLWHRRRRCGRSSCRSYCNSRRRHCESYGSRGNSGYGCGKGCCSCSRTDAKAVAAAGAGDGDE